MVRGSHRDASMGVAVANPMAAGGIVKTRSSAGRVSATVQGRDLLTSHSASTRHDATGRSSGVGTGPGDSSSISRSIGHRSAGGHGRARHFVRRLSCPTRSARFVESHRDKRTHRHVGWGNSSCSVTCGTTACSHRRRLSARDRTAGNAGRRRPARAGGSDCRPHRWCGLSA